MTTKKPATFVAQVDLAHADKIKAYLEDSGYELTRPPYTLFSGKKKGVNCSLYTSGKLVVQGKGKDELIEFFLEPEVLDDFSYTHPPELDLTERIGCDEAGKGDFFGPLVVASCHATKEQIKKLEELGIADSKKLSDNRVIALARKIVPLSTSHVIALSPEKYNELYAKFGNLNRLLAWAHAAAMETVVQKTGCKEVILDQFAYPTLMEKVVQQKKLAIHLVQRVRAESDLLVAAASILARAKFVKSIESLSNWCGVDLPKGASSKVKDAGRAYIAKHGREELHKVAKMHFKTQQEL